MSGADSQRFQDTSAANVDAQDSIIQAESLSTVTGRKPCEAPCKSEELREQVADVLFLLNRLSAKLYGVVFDERLNGQFMLDLCPGKLMVGPTKEDERAWQRCFTLPAEKSSPAYNVLVSQSHASAGCAQALGVAACSNCGRLQADLAKKEAAYQAISARLAVEEARRHELEEMLDGCEETKWGLVQQLGDREHACHMLLQQLEDERRKSVSKESSVFTVQQPQVLDHLHRQPACKMVSDHCRAASVVFDTAASATATQQCVEGDGTAGGSAGMDMSLSNQMKDASVAEGDVVADMGPQANGFQTVVCLEQPAATRTLDIGQLAMDRSDETLSKEPVAQVVCNKVHGSDEWLLVDVREAEHSCPMSAELAAAGEGLHIDVEMSTWGALPEEVQQWLAGLKLSDVDGLNIDVEMETWDELPAAVQHWIAGMQLYQHDDIVYGHPVHQQALGDVPSGSSQSQELQFKPGHHYEAESDVLDRSNSSTQHRLAFTIAHLAQDLPFNNDRHMNFADGERCSINDVTQPDCNSHDSEALVSHGISRGTSKASSDMLMDDLWTMVSKPFPSDQ